MSGKTQRFDQTCTITRNPMAGQTGITTIVNDLTCTSVYPASATLATRYAHATEWEPLQMYALASAARKNDIVTINGKTYIIQENNPYPGRRGRSGFSHFVLRERL